MPTTLRNMRTEPNANDAEEPGRITHSVKSLRCGHEIKFSLPADASKDSIWKTKLIVEPMRCCKCLAAMWAAKERK